MYAKGISSPAAFINMTVIAATDVYPAVSVLSHWTNLLIDQRVDQSDYQKGALNYVCYAHNQAAYNDRAASWREKHKRGSINQKFFQSHKLKPAKSGSEESLNFNTH